MTDQNSKSTLFTQCPCIILVSGGMDSAACIDFYKRQEFTVSGLHISYEQPAAKQEVIAATTIAQHYKIPLTFVRFAGGRPKADGEIVGRNALLVFTALMEIEAFSAILALGIHAGTHYYDCSVNFLAAAQTIVDGQCGGRIRIAAPFIEWTKKEIWDYCIEHKVPIDLTYSCEKGMDHPCGTCLSCRDMEALRVC